jgi:microcystin-dependent protein
MAGYWPSSAQQINDLNGRPIVGAKAFFYRGGTTTPLEVYRDYGLTNPHPNPLTTDGYGRFPSVFFDEVDGFYDFRLTTDGGTLLYTAAQVPIVGPKDTGGDTPAAPVDPDATAQTGDMMQRYGTGFRSGWVRCNARTIGSALSGASERAAADCQPLYEHLWAADNTLVVLGGRGGSASADWLANKPLTLPDYRGRAMVGLDTMVNTAAGIIPAATAISWSDGEATHKLTTEEMPSHSHTGSTSSAGAHAHQVGASYIGSGNSSNGGYVTPSGTGAATTTNGDHTHDVTVTSTGGGANHNNIQPSKGVSIYIRL